MKAYPQNRDEWIEAIQQGIGLSCEQGRDLYMQGTFPMEHLREWITKEFAEGFGPNFVPALLRNIHGLVSWVYGEGTEPYWPGSDDDYPVQE